jgi:hypothetical protein
VLSHILYRINKELEWFERVEFFHVLKAMNRKVDELANMASTLDQGIFRDKRGQAWVPIP